MKVMLELLDNSASLSSIKLLEDLDHVWKKSHSLVVDLQLLTMIAENHTNGTGEKPTILIVPGSFSPSQSS